MLQSIAHRGPDATSHWSENEITLGHNRLSIIDLAETANQPMFYDDLVLIFNGEIYNYIEIRKELEQKNFRFKTQSDSEIILASYKAWGKDCVTRFVGMWALVIWDRTNKTLFASRDRFGIKPFYYISHERNFWFASEIKALKHSPHFSNDLNMNQISRGLQLGWTGYQDETYFSKVKSLPPAHNLIFQNGEIKIERYWDISFGQKSNLSFDDKREQFREMFFDSIKLHMRSDVEVGGCLSGGIDSSAIAGSIGKLYPDLKFKTFTIFYSGDGEVDERPFAKTVLEKYPSLVPFFYEPKGEELTNEFDRIQYHQDVPLPGSSPISQYFVMKLAAQQKMKVLVDGQGSDEYLFGYLHSYYRYIGGLIAKMSLIKAMRTRWQLGNQQSYSIKKRIDLRLKSFLSAVFGEQRLYAEEYKRNFPFLTNINSAEIPFDLENKGDSRLDKFLYQLLFNTMLPSLLHFEDRNSMAFSIESRVPFLDHRLVEFAFTLDDDDKVNYCKTKYILRESLKDILPSSVYQRTDKKGFVTPGEVKWLRGPLKHLTEIDANKLDILDKRKVKSILERYKTGDNRQAKLVWRIATLNHWLK